MKAIHIVALLMMVLMVGCATKQQEAAPETPPAVPETPPAAPATTPAAPATTPAAPAAVKGDIVITSAGFDPAEMTVEVGTTLAIKSSEGKHKLTVDGTATPVIEEGSAYDVTFSKVGKIRVFDILSKKSAYITVTEKAVEAAAAEATA